MVLAELERNSKENAGEGPVVFALKDLHATALLCFERGLQASFNLVGRSKCLL